MSPFELILELKTYRVVPRLVNDELTLAGNTMQLPAHLLAAVRAAKPVLTGLVQQARNSHYSAIPVTPVQDSYPASHAQQRMWVLSQFEDGAAYSITKGFLLAGVDDASLFNTAISATIARHDILRTVFTERGGEIRQVVQPASHFVVEHEDISNHPQPLERLAAAMEQASNQRFNLATGPLLRVHTYSLPGNRLALIISIHHIITDGGSLRLLLAEMMETYRQLPGSAVNKEAIALQYKDYTAWMNRRIQEGQLEDNAAYWKNELAQLPAPLHIPANFARPAIRTSEGAIARVYFDAALYSRIQQFCNEQPATIFNFLRSVLNILLYRLSGQEDIIIGVPVAGRGHAALEKQQGLFVNTLPLRYRLNPADSFAELLQQISRHSAKAFRHQEYPFDRIVQDAAVPPDTGRNPLFDVMLTLQDISMGGGTAAIARKYDLQLSLLDELLPLPANDVDRSFAVKFDLNFNFDADPVKGFYVEAEYSTRLFTPATIQRWLNSLLHITGRVLQNPQTYIQDIAIITPGEKQQILEEFNQPVETISQLSIPQLLSPAFAAHGDKTAIISGNETVSYNQLWQLANQVSAYILQSGATGRHPFVGVLMGRSQNTIAAILGILNAGAAYVPVDIHYPAARIDYILNDAMPGLLITDSMGRAAIPAGYTGVVADIDEILKTGTVLLPATSADLREAPAYLIYTSGSTGIPKGVEICHRNAIAFLQWAGEEFANTPYHILYAVTSYCFDLSVFEFFVPLLQGKIIRVLESALDIPLYLEQDQHIMLNTVPSVIRHLLDAGMNWEPVVAINMAGEPIPHIIKAALDYHRMEVRNLYGPSEDTTYSTIYRFDDMDTPTIPIGRPVGYTQLYIMDAHRNLLPVGVEGEIYLSGQSVAKGYYGKPALTAAAFMDNPFIPGLPMYKTGDIGKWLPDGQVLFTGRIDDQVKVRGYRIELGEIQYQLEQHAAVERAVVMVRPLNGTPHIVAYWVSEQEISPAILKDWLSQKLPLYMVPDYWVQLAAIPLNSNGKVDKNQLPLPGAIAPVAITAPENELQQQLLAAWKQLLQHDELGIHHNFFNSGGHSLKALQLRWLVLQQLQKEITIQEIFIHTTIAQQALLLAAKAAPAMEPIPVAPVQPYYPISIAQERLWVLTSFEEASKAYNMPAAFQIKGTLDVALLTRAVQAIIDRFEILRTVFRMHNDEPVQVILPAGTVTFELEHIQLKQGDDETACLQTLWQQPFNLEQGPLLRGWLLQTGNRQVLSFAMHHIISDGWSVAVLLRHIAEAYRALVTGTAVTVAAPAIQFKDFAVWQRQRLSGTQLEAARTFWKQEFAGDIPVLDMPLDYNRPAVKTYTGDTVSLLVNEQVLVNLQQVCRQSGVTLFTALVSTVAILLKKYSGQNDLVIGTPVAGRDRVELQDQPGFFVNTLPLRFRLNGDDSFTALLQKQQRHILSAFEHQAYRFEMLVEELQPRRNLSRSPLFDIMVSLQNPEGLQQTGSTVLSDTLSLERLAVTAGVAKYDCSFLFEERANGLLLELEYNTALYTKETATRMANHLAMLLDRLATEPVANAVGVSMLDAAEEQQVLRQFNQPIEAVEEYSITALLAQSFREKAGQTAVLTATVSLTYAQLEERANAVAARIQELLPQHNNAFVAMLLERTEWMPVVMLGILKAGAAYVPADIQYPAQRIEYIINDAAPALLIVDDAGLQVVPSTYTGPVLHVAELADVTGLTPVQQQADQREQAAYLIYTSGSTGKPKGVEICHRNTIAFLKWAAVEFAYTPFQLLYATTSYCFDLSVFEIFFPLMQGKTIRILPSALAIPEFIEEDRQVMINTVPSAVRNLVDGGMSWKHVSALNMAGEPIPRRLKGELDFTHIEVRNLYGPSEDTTYSTCYRFANDGYAFIPIGRPVGYTQLYILDSEGQLLPPGINGEIYLSGQSVAKGYYNKPALTAERFLPNPFVPGMMMYRTGDTGRWLADGQVAFEGRADEQVKIRGFRIEPGEIQYILEQHPQVDETVVLPVLVNDEQQLAVYWAGDTDTNTADLQAWLLQNLPAYMAPDYWIYLDAIPLNSNGKVDKKALPAPAAVAPVNSYTGPRNATDEQLIAIWEDVLQRDNIGITHNFFDLGGHSLKATRVAAKVYEAFGVKIDIVQFFSVARVQELSDYVEAVKWAAAGVGEKVEADEDIII